MNAKTKNDLRELFNNFMKEELNGRLTDNDVARTGYFNTGRNRQAGDARRQRVKLASRAQAPCHLR
jgi:hypothetical protein